MQTRSQTHKKSMNRPSTSYSEKKPRKIYSDKSSESAPKKICFEVGLSEKGLIEVDKWANKYLHDHSISLDSYYQKDAKRLWDDWKNETNTLKKKELKTYYDKFCEFLKKENYIVDDTYF